MREICRKLLVVSVTLALTACAAGRQNFTQNHRSMSEVKVCRNIIKEKDFFYGKYQPQPSEVGYFSALKLAKRTRNLTISGCQETVKKADAKITMAIIAIGAAAAAVDAANSSSGGGGEAYSAPTYQSYGATGYAWDLIDSPHNAFQTIYVCRNKSNGQFAEHRFCSHLLKNDNTWPGT